MNIANEERQSLLTIKQAAQRLNVCRRTLEREIQRGRFPRPLKIGTASRWPAEDVETYLDSLNQSRGPIGGT
jgi:excisionase family DNA binding protein